MDMTVEVPELPELTFDEASHIYRLNGDIIPSVSKLMEPLKDQCYGGISKRTLENAAVKGSAVHNSIENWIKFGIDDIPSEHRGYFTGFMEWWKQYKPRVFGSEVRIYHKLMRYGGTIDLLCEIGGLLELGGRFAGLGSETTLETYVYRPMIRALTLFFAAVFGFLGGLTDFVADLIARKVLSARRKKLENRVGNAVTRAVGGVFDGMAEGLNQTVLRGHQIEHHAMARISAAWDGAMDAISEMSQTMSYGLVLLGLGLCVTLLYLMFY